MKCANCMWKYPDSLLSPLITNLFRTKPICGICALELVNEIYEVKKDSFSGTIAEVNRQAAIKYRKNNPADAPKLN